MYTCDILGIKTVFTGQFKPWNSLNSLEQMVFISFFYSLKKHFSHTLKMLSESNM